MTAFLFILAIILIAVVLRSVNILTSKIQELSESIDELKKSGGIRKESLEPVKQAETPRPKWKEPEPYIPPVRSEPEITVPSSRPAPRIEPEIVRPPVEPPAIPKKEPVPEPQLAAGSTTIERENYIHKPFERERNTDWEKFIGENLINKIGIGILVLGIAFFVKYAIDKNWINEIGRVMIGILCGGVLVALAHRMRNKFKAFSSVLMGGGIAVFYFTIAIAFHEYKLFGQTEAFIIMVLITAFAVTLSILYDRIELAVLAIIGGFSTPFMVSTGSGNYIVLFTYLLILNTGMLVLAYFRKWPLINILSYVFTIFIFGGWLTLEVLVKSNAPYMGTLVFATLFYLVFFLMNIINNIRQKKPFAALDYSILLSNTFLYYAAGMLILENIDKGIYKGLFTALMAVFNLCFVLPFYRNRMIDRNLVFTLIGLVLTFLSLTAPVQLDGNWITMFWALEAVLLLWLYQRSSNFLIKLASVAVTWLMVISLVMDWFQLYFSSGIYLPVLINRAFITGALSLVSLYVTGRLLRREKEVNFLPEIPLTIYREIIDFSILIGSYLVVLLELSHQLNEFVVSQSARSIILGIYNLGWVVGLQYFLGRKQDSKLVPLTIVLGLAALLSFAAYYHQEVINVRYEWMAGKTSALWFYAHYILTGIAIAIIGFFLKGTRELAGDKSQAQSMSLWIAAFFIVFIASGELNHLVVAIGTQLDQAPAYLLKQNIKIGYPIVWGLCSFAFMLTGIRKKIRTLRIISLALFLIIILKLFLFDIRGISEGGKIAAFITLGVILLTVSFLYQKLKELIFADTVSEETKQEEAL